MTKFINEVIFNVGDRIQVVRNGIGPHEGPFIVTGWRHMGCSSAIGSQGYITDIALELRSENHPELSVEKRWQSFCKLISPAPLSVFEYEDAIAAVEAMEKVSE